ncbi:MAG TPA: hypothetical protein VGL70_00110 [Candidatus Binatia bacterium]|jgi:hypothetical protein
MAHPISSHFAHNIESLGYQDLNGKLAFKPAMQEAKTEILRMGE